MAGSGLQVKQKWSSQQHQRHKSYHITTGKWDALISVNENNIRINAEMITLKERERWGPITPESNSNVCFMYVCYIYISTRTSKTITIPVTWVITNWKRTGVIKRIHGTVKKITGLRNGDSNKNKLICLGSEYILCWY